MAKVCLCLTLSYSESQICVATNEMHFSVRSFERTFLFWGDVVVKIEHIALDMKKYAEIVIKKLKEKPIA